MNPTLASVLAPVLAVGSGLAALAGHPPVGWWWTTFLAPALLLAALWVDASAARAQDRGVRAGRLGVLSGLAAFGPLLTWLILPAGHIGWALLVLVQAAWMGLLALLVRPALDHWSLPLVVAVAWTGIDAWRALVPMNGFEWGAIAYAHVGGDGSWLLPVARLVGGRGITFLVVLIGAAAATVVRQTWISVRERGDTPVEVALGGTKVAVGFLVGGLLASVLATIEPPAETGSLDVLVVQGNDVRHWEEDGGPNPPLRITTRLRDLTLEAVERDGAPDLTVWPESSIDRDPFSDRGAELGVLADEAAQAVGTLLAGTVFDGPDPTAERYVAAVLLVDGLTETDRYIKRRLVPFGEFIPMRAWLDWFPPLDQIPRDALPGPGPQAMEVLDGVRAAVIICFETMFSDVVRSNVLTDDDPAQLIITMTNDASFGDSAEPAQHLAQSQLRAVETGRWVVHGALSGSSAFVDPAGGISQATPVFELATIRTDVPLVEGLTPYLVIGDVLGWVTRAAALLLGVALSLQMLRRRRDDDATSPDRERAASNPSVPAG